MTLTDLLEKLTSLAANSRQQGDAFERMMLTYLQIDPIFAERFEKVFLLRDWPDRPRGMIDDGIDLVGIEVDGGACAIQCKFIAAESKVSRSDIDSFMAASSRMYFSTRLIIATTDQWGENATKVLADQDPPVTRIGLSELLDAPIGWSIFDPDRPTNLLRTPRRDLREHQRDAISDVRRGFASHDQGKLIMACGTGKTFTSLRLAEEMVGRGGHVLFLVPSIALLSQASREWTRESRIPLQSLAVCSDRDASRVDKDSEDQQVIDLLLPATTKPDRLASHLATARHRAAIADRGEPMYVTFSTYQSLGVIEQAQRDYGFPRFDLILCDEAHRTAGIGGVQEDSSFVLVHDHERIIANKRLFMTATPRSMATKQRPRQTPPMLCCTPWTMRHTSDRSSIGLDSATRSAGDFSLTIASSSLPWTKPMRRNLCTRYTQVPIVTSSSATRQSCSDAGSDSRKSPTPIPSSLTTPTP